MSYSLLDNINSPKDLKSLNRSQILSLSSEIREFLIENVEKSGGHLASNLGIVELTLAIHRVFDSPDDHIIFDVGHQSYVHKILTGRRPLFSDLRTPGGLSGFTSRRESAHDPFGAGHSSTSVSAALGFAEADALAGRKNYTVAVIGDGAYTGGMVHEALNNCRPSLPLIIILNENGMSISSNKGTFASYLSRVRISGKYRKWKAGTNNFFLRIPLIGKPIKKLLTFTKERIKRLIYPANYFEELGLYYMGPIDGNNYDKVERALASAKRFGGTVVVHVKTQKGKGYAPAEKSPDGYHSVGGSGDKATYHSVFAEELIGLAEKNEKIVAVTAAMGMGTGLDSFGEKFPKRYFDVGIAEEHALTFSAGLAANGLSPFVAIYSTFLQRGYDSILHDIALQNLPVKIMIDRAGLSVGDGATHHGIFDVAFLSHIPNISLYAPASYSSLAHAICLAERSPSPVAIRYPNAQENEAVLRQFVPLDENELCTLSVNFDIENPPANIIITYGRIIDNVIKAQTILEKNGISVGIILAEQLKPYKKMAEKISKLISRASLVLYVEEGIRHGGAAEITADELASAGHDFTKTEYLIAAIDDDFVAPTEKCDLYDYVGLSPEKIASRITKNDSQCK